MIRLNWKSILWRAIIDAWERGDFDRVNRLLCQESNDLPPFAAQWLAGALSGKIKRPRGRPRTDPDNQTVGSAWREFRIQEDYRVWLYVYQTLAKGKRLRGNTPTHGALEKLAEMYGLTTDEVSRIVHPRRPRKARNSAN